MPTLTKAQIDAAEAGALGGRPMRPRDAATLMLLDRSGGGFKVLMGRRHARHAFMPGKFVFPGGRTDPADARIAVAADLHPEVWRKLTAGNRLTPARARAIALSAIRETYEEAGLLIGAKGPFSTAKPDWQGFAEHGVQPSLQTLRLVARAITPPNRVRRFDTRFFVAWREDVAVRAARRRPDQRARGNRLAPARRSQDRRHPRNHPHGPRRPRAPAGRGPESSRHAGAVLPPGRQEFHARAAVKGDRPFHCGRCKNRQVALLRAPSVLPDISPARLRITHLFVPTIA